MTQEQTKKHVPPLAQTVQGWIDNHATTYTANAIMHDHAQTILDLLESVKLAHEFLDSLPKGWLGKTSGDVGALNDFYCLSKPALAKAEGK